MIDRIAVLRWIRNRVEQIFEIANAQLVLTEVAGNFTTDGTEQILFDINNPFGVFKPLKLKIDLENMTWGDVVILRWYEILDVPAGNRLLKDQATFEGPQNTVVDPAYVKNIDLEANRWGLRVTIEQSAGTYRTFLWEALYEV